MRIKFPNGWTFSAIEQHRSKTTVEVAAWDSEDNWYNFDEGEPTRESWVANYVSGLQLAEFLIQISKLPATLKNERFSPLPWSK